MCISTNNFIKCVLRVYIYRVNPNLQIMKNLLYLFALVLFITSCSVERIEDENPISTYKQGVTTKAVEGQTACTVTDIIDTNGKKVGILEVFTDVKKDVMVVQLTTVDWKIKETQVFLGPYEEVPFFQTQEDLNLTYSYDESFINNIYIAGFKFNLSDVKEDFYLVAKAKISDDFIEKPAFAEGEQFSPNSMTMYISSLAESCL